MNDFQFMQIMDWAREAGVDLAVIKDENGKPVIVALGDEAWLDELVSALSAE